MSNTEKTFSITKGTQEYKLIITEYIGIKTLKYMLRAELWEGKRTALFLLGIPDPAVFYAANTRTYLINMGLMKQVDSTTDKVHIKESL